MKIELEKELEVFLNGIVNDSKIFMALHLNEDLYKQFRKLRETLAITQEQNTKNSKDYQKGLDDAYSQRGYKPTTMAYVDGYENGLKLRKLLLG